MSLASPHAYPPGKCMLGAAPCGRKDGMNNVFNGAVIKLWSGYAELVLILVHVHVGFSEGFRSLASGTSLVLLWHGSTVDFML